MILRQISMKQFWKSNKWKYLIAFLLPMLVVVTTHTTLDNDSWYALAEGRQIVENGIYYTDELSMHEDLAVTVQNYGWGVMYYLAYSVLGAPGCYLVMLVLNLLIMVLVYKICMLISNKNVNLSLILMMATDVTLAMGFTVTRGQMVSYVLMLAVIYVLELYVKKDKAKYLWWIPLLSVAQINMNAAMWPIMLLVIGVYLVEAVVRIPKLGLKGYRAWPLVVALAAAVIVGLINPYGVEMMTFIFTSYRVPEISSFVGEMLPFEPLKSVWSLGIFVAISAVILGYVFGEGKNVRMRYLLMFFGFLALGLDSVRGMSQLILVMFFPLALVYKDKKWPKLIDSAKARRAIMAWTGVVTTCLTVATVAVVLMEVKAEPWKNLAEAVDVIDERVPEGERKSTKVYVNYDNGGYVEFRGYGAFLDPRAEVYLKVNNGKADILKEWHDYRQGYTGVKEFLDKYDFDYLLVGRGDHAYDLEDEDYELIYEYEEGNWGNKVYKKVGG